MRGAYGAKGSHDPGAGAEPGGHGPRVRAGRKLTLELSIVRRALRRARNRLGRHRLEWSNELENKASFRRHRPRSGVLDGAERHPGAGALLRRLRLSGRLPALSVRAGVLPALSDPAATAAGPGFAAADRAPASAARVPRAGHLSGAGGLSRAGRLSRICPPPSAPA